MPVGRRRHPGSAAGGESDGCFCLGDDSWPSCAEGPHRYGTSTRERQNSGWQPFFFVLFLLLFLGLLGERPTHACSRRVLNAVRSPSPRVARPNGTAPPPIAASDAGMRQPRQGTARGGAQRRGTRPGRSKTTVDKKNNREDAAQTRKTGTRTVRGTPGPTSRTGKVASRDACSKTGAHPTDRRRQLKQPATGGTEQGVTEQIDAPLPHHPREVRALGGTATVDSAPKLLNETPMKHHEVTHKPQWHSGHPHRR